MIALLDCNNFFVSCERLFRPDIQKKPVLVLSSNDGCVVARSQEVKDLGIPMGIPFFEIKDTCKKNGIIVFSSNFSLYQDISTRVMSVLKSEYDRCEVYSVDEAFFEVDQVNIDEHMARLRSVVIKNTGIPVSIGVGDSKTIAKAAARVAKNGSGVCIMNQALWDRTIPSISCGSIWGVGRNTTEQLTKLGIHSVSELLSKDRELIRSHFGVVGERLCMELGGVQAYPIGKKRENEQESYTSTRSFAKPVSDKLVLMSALGYHVARVAEKLREAGCVAGQITVIVRASRFSAFSHRVGKVSLELEVSTNDTVMLTKEASKLLDTLYDSQVPYKKAGVIVSKIIPISATANSLFEDVHRGQNIRSVSSVSDSINKIFGRDTIRTGVTTNMHGWRSGKALVSREYTTKWTELAIVKAT